MWIFFVENSAENGNALIAGLLELGFKLTQAEAAEVRRGKHFIQLKNGPFDLDLIFAPDGIEKLEQAWCCRTDVNGFSVCNIDDIIAGKIASNRPRERESLPRLQSFREYLRNQGRV